MAGKESYERIAASTTANEKLKRKYVKKVLVRTAAGFVHKGKSDVKSSIRMNANSVTGRFDGT